MVCYIGAVKVDKRRRSDNLSRYPGTDTIWHGLLFRREPIRQEVDENLSSRGLMLYAPGLITSHTSTWDRPRRGNLSTTVSAIGRKGSLRRSTGSHWRTERHILQRSGNTIGELGRGSTGHCRTRCAQRRSTEGTLRGWVQVRVKKVKTNHWTEDPATETFMKNGLLRAPRKLWRRYLLSSSPPPPPLLPRPPSMATCDTETVGGVG